MDLILFLSHTLHHKIIYLFITHSMKLFKLFTQLLCLIILFVSCNKDKNSSPSLTPVQREMQNNVLNLQQINYDLLVDLQDQTDSLSAIDSVVNMFLADTTVEWAKSNSQGIIVQYKSGIKGGIMLNSERYTGIDPEIDEAPVASKTMDVNFKTGKGKSTVKLIVPPTERTLFICPIYKEFSLPADIIMDQHDEQFIKTHYWIPERDLDDHASLEKFTFLENYGVIIIYSHGLAWPDNDLILEVYLMTGEIVNELTSSRYWKYINDGIIPLIFAQNSNYYYVSPEFITSYNNFERDTTLIYGGFCYSSLGTWATEMTGAGAGGYFGYDWSVFSKASDLWERNLFENLTDTSLSKPMTCMEWMNGNTIGKWYRDKFDEINVHIEYFGIPDLALWDKKEPSSYNRCFIWSMTNATWEFNDGSFENQGDYLSGSNVTGEMSGDTVFYGTWDGPYLIGGSYSGELKVTGDFSRYPYVITDYRLSAKTISSDTITEIIEGKNISFIGYDRTVGGAEFYERGTGACNYITNMTYHVDGHDGVYFRDLYSYECVENSYIQLTFVEY